MEEKVTLRQLEEAGLNLEEFWWLSNVENKEEQDYRISQLTEGQRELLETSDMNATYFVREKIFEAVMEGAEKVRVMRDVFKPTTFALKRAGKDYRFVLHETRNGTLQEVPPTAEYPIPTNESYREVLFETRKYGEICLIEEELIEDSMFDIIEMRMRDLGERAENTVNQKMLDALIDCGNSSNVSYVYTEPFWSIAAAIKQLKINGYKPDALIMTAQMEGDLPTDPHYRQSYSGEISNFRREGGGAWTGIPSILGLKMYVCTIDSNSSTANGAYGATNGIQGIVMETAKAGGYCFKEDIGLSKFEDPKNDLFNIKVRVRFDSKCFYGKAISFLKN